MWIILYLYTCRVQLFFALLGLKIVIFMMSYNAHYNKIIKYDKIQKYFPFLAYRIFFRGRICFVVLINFIVKGGEISNPYTHHILHLHIFLDLLLIFNFSPFLFKTLKIWKLSECVCQSMFCVYVMLPMLSSRGRFWNHVWCATLASTKLDIDMDTLDNMDTFVVFGILYWA
jgi:hypothetical protein